VDLRKVSIPSVQEESPFALVESRETSDHQACSGGGAGWARPAEEDSGELSGGTLGERRWAFRRILGGTSWSHRRSGNAEYRCTMAGA
jgi:hypothetical protein